jgi:uncharacterized protein (TIGR03067 family)
MSESATIVKPIAPAVRRRAARLLPPLIAVAIVAVSVWFMFFRTAGDDLSRLQGDWTPNTADGRNTGVVIRVQDDVWSYHAGPHGRSYKLTLRPDRSPKEIDLALLGDDGRPATFTHGAGKGSEVKLQGIYAFEGDVVKVALGVKQRPTNFEDEDAQLLLLTR